MNTRNGKRQAPAPRISRHHRVNVVIDLLISAPERIHAAQQAFNQIERAYQKRLAEVGLSAFEALLFQGKDGSKRIASNDKEREIAIDTLVTNDQDLIALAEKREEKLAALQRERNRQDAARAASRLLAQKE